jgi:arylsulfatase A-like enzyme/Flp pilus assembly protein TadD
VRAVQSTTGKQALPIALVVAFLCGTSCDKEAPERVVPQVIGRPSILLVTLDTTRADRLGFDSGLYETPALDALAARGIVFEHAYSTVPMTLPAHASMFTGQYPSEHGIHENGRYVADSQPILAEEMQKRGYATAAFVSGYPLSSEFGVARGFDHFDDDFGGSGLERDATATTNRAVDYLEEASGQPRFVWVHYFDPHEPYDPPPPYDAQYADDPYQGEIAFMDRELGRLLEGFESSVGDRAFRVVVVGDHGEGLGEHGEVLHGRLLYQGVMRVPLVVAGSGLEPVRVDRPVSSRQAFETILGWADTETAPGWMSDSGEPVLAEALKPYLQYGWQPQVMGVSGSHKVIRSGETEIYDVVADPGEQQNLAGEAEVDRALLEAVRDYPVNPGFSGEESGGQSETQTESLSEEAVRKLASLGYFDSGPGRGLREDAPNPKDMTRIFRDLDIGSALFVKKEFGEAIRIFSRVHELDPENLVVTLRLAVAHSVLGNEREAEEFFGRARQISPASIDLRHYHAMHYVRFDKLDLAMPLFESVLAEMPKRLPALEGMARIHQVRGDLDQAKYYLDRIVALKDEPVAELLQLGSMSMARQDTPAAIDYFERAMELQGDEFEAFLDLGVLYLASRQFERAASALDRVSPEHPAFDLALFKRAQVAVLLQEPDMQERVWRAEAEAGEMVRQLIANEPLFRNLKRGGGA